MSVLRNGWLVTLIAGLAIAACSDGPEGGGGGGGGAGGADPSSNATAGMAPMPPNCSVCGEVFSGGADEWSLCGLQSVLTNTEGTINCVPGTSCSLLKDVQQCLGWNMCDVPPGPPVCEDQACIDCVTAACPTEVAACEQDMF